MNNNGPVFFLAGNLGGDSARTITVPAGKPVFFPVLNSFYAAVNGNGDFDPSPCVTLTLSCALQQVTPTQDNASSMVVQIDGVTVLDNTQIEQHRQTSTSFFAVALPQDNVFGVPTQNYDQCCAKMPIWAQDGFWVTLDDLSAGSYLLPFHAESGDFSVDVTDTLNVVPEPSTWAMMTVGFLGLVIAGYRARAVRPDPDGDAMTSLAG